MRLQVFLAHAGVCSRRSALSLIQSGRVSIGRKIIFEPSYQVRESEENVTLDGKAVLLPQAAYVLLNKPKGVVTTTRDRFAPRTVLDLLPRTLKHLHPAGRLDKDTTGLLLLTNDGLLTHRLLHPSFETEKTYRATLDRDISEGDIARLQKGVVLDGKKTAACRIKRMSARELEIVLHEGRKRQIRRMFALLRYRVLELSRIRQGSLTLGDIKIGAWRFLSREETARLKKELKMI